jgi:Flp pilus assembly protein TadG
MKHEVKSFLGRLREDRSGAVFIYAAASMLALLGFGAVVVDVSYVFHAKRVLQASTDAAALAGATTLSTGTPGEAVATANTYSAASGDKNANANLTITAAPQTVNCTGNSGSTCTATQTSPNGIEVSETATVPTYFARALGINSVSMSTSAYALQSGGKAQNMDILLILDTTDSMGTTDNDSTDTSCSSVTREACALIGLQQMISGFTPPTQQVGIEVFPGLQTAAEAAQDYGCPNKNSYPSVLAGYTGNASAQPPYYQVLGLQSNYKSGSSLDTSSNLVIAAHGGTGSCAGTAGAGIQGNGGEGTYYADAITAAEDYLTANGRAGSQKVIILLSDGQASGNAQGSISSSKVNTGCTQGVNAAAAAKSAGTIVVTIAYGSTTGGNSGCAGGDTISSCTAMTEMATVGTGTSTAPQYFYSDDQGSGVCDSPAHAMKDLTSIFKDLGGQLTSGGARLIPGS